LARELAQIMKIPEETARSVIRRSLKKTRS
jgi:DNA-directed RNA polymerase specialized sigma24 family protein